SSDNDEYDSDDSVPGPSGHSTSKRPRLGSECLVDEVHEEFESEQHSDGEIQHDKNPIPEAEQAEIGNDVQTTLRHLSASVWGAPVGNHSQFDKTYEGGIKPDWQAPLRGHNPVWLL
ncbi:hypothetical protein JTB14_020367, partial [Gonioctena quinquepunctata]